MCTHVQGLALAAGALSYVISGDGESSLGRSLGRATAYPAAASAYAKYAAAAAARNAFGGFGSDDDAKEPSTPPPPAATEEPPAFL